MDCQIKIAQDSFMEFTCPICHKLLQKCVTTLCGHSYCEACLDDYLIYKETCFVCDFWGTKRVLIRDKPVHVSFKVDDVINQIIDNCKNKAIKSDWLERQAEHLKAQKERQVGELEIDQLVDVRDTEYIWCVGQINLIIEPINKDPMYVVHFVGKPSSEDEVIYKNSDRLAKHGFFTARDGIPNYETWKDKETGTETQILHNQILNSAVILLNAQKALNQEHLLESQLDDDKEKQKKSPSGLLPLIQDADELNDQDEIQQQITGFFNSFEERNIDQMRKERWSHQQSHQNRPIYLRNVIDSFQQ